MPVKQTQYILIAGLPRSGSTLLQAVMNQSESTFTLPETHFFEQAGKLTSESWLSRQQTVDLLRTLQSKWHLSLASLIDEAESGTKKTDLYELYFKIIELYRPEQSDHAIGLEKTPGNLFAISTLLKRGYDVKVILTTRNCRDFANSMLKCYWAPDSLQGIARLWNESMDEIHRLKTQFSGRVTTLDYEAMTTAPEDEFRRIYEFAGLVWQSQYLSNLNANADRFIVASESDWKRANLQLPSVNKSVKQQTLNWRQRLLLHRQCLGTALSTGYLKYYKF